MSEYEESNASRYYESYVCRTIADCVFKTTTMNMLIANDSNDAVYESVRMLSCGSLHLSLLPVVYERLISRLLQYESLLAITTIGIELDVPVISTESMFQFFNGVRITNRDEYNVLRTFCSKCYASNMFLNAGGVLGGDYGLSQQDPCPYITSPGAWDTAAGTLMNIPLPYFTC